MALGLGFRLKGLFLKTNALSYTYCGDHLQTTNVKATLYQYSGNKGQLLLTQPLNQHLLQWLLDVMKPIRSTPRMLILLSLTALLEVGVEGGVSPFPVHGPRRPRVSPMTLSHPVCDKLLWKKMKILTQKCHIMSNSCGKRGSV